MALSKEETDRLLSKLKLCYMATTFSDGSPHVVPIWFVVHDGKLVFQTTASTKWFKNVERDNRVAVCFGGRETYLARGTVSIRNMGENDPVEQLFREKYSSEVKDSYFNDESRVLTLDIKTEISWH